ncbi:MAG: right-handed parallel beta-helix repeat-containing protein [Actinomycetota bacterium]
MSYTLRGRLESRLAALAPPVLVAAAVHHWWLIELAGLMAGVVLLLDLVYHRPIAYQPGWAAVPLGLLELGCILLAMRLLGIMAPLRWALVFFAASWLWAQLLGHVLLPLARLSYAEDGGELGVALGAVALAALVLPFAAAGGIYEHNLPPVVRLSAGVHQGPLYIRHRVRLVGERGTIVRGGIVVLHRGVTVSHVHVVGGEYGISVLGVKNVTLDHVTVQGATLDGIHVRHANVHVHDCLVDERGMPDGQGIDVSYGMIQGDSMIDGCTVVGGRDGIVVHGSMGMIEHNTVTATKMTGISLVEMSMGSVAHNHVAGALGIGILCGDHSMCDMDHNTVVGTRPDGTANAMRSGIGLEVEFGAEAELGAHNDLVANPRHLGVFLDSTVFWK